MNHWTDNDGHEHDPARGRPNEEPHRTPTPPTEPPKAYEPEVMRPDGRPTYRITTEPAQAVVIHCGDPRFQNAFRSFVTNELGITNYMPIIIGGGAHAFGAQSLLPKNFKILWEQLKFAIKSQNVKEVIIINHEDCRWYEKMKGYHTHIHLPVKAQQDLRSAAQTVFRDFTGVRVRTFWASLDGDLVSFEEVK